MRLFGYWQSSATWRVRLALSLKNIDYDYVPVNLLKGEQRKPEYLARNPQGLVPVLETNDGTCLAQSLAIIHYLEKQFPKSPLLPMDPVMAAKAEAIAIMINSEAQPFGNRRVLQYLKTKLGFDEGKISDWMNQWPGQTLGVVETLMPANGAFFSDERPGLPEIFIIPQLYAARRFGADIGAFTNLLATEKRCEGLDTFFRAHPFQQIDSTK